MINKYDWTPGENKPKLLAFSVLRKESQGQRSPQVHRTPDGGDSRTADSIKMRNLKKQSQFSKVEMDVSVYYKGCYGKILCFQAAKKQSQSKHVLSIVERANLE